MSPRPSRPPGPPGPPRPPDGWSRRCRGGARRAVALVAVLAVLVLAGCAAIPRQGPIVDGPRLDTHRGGVLQLQPAGPSATSTPAELVRGFLRAAPAFANDHEVARSFLHGARRLSWRPDSPVVVVPGESSVVTTTGPVVAGTTPLTITGAGVSGAPGAVPASPGPSSSPPVAGATTVVTVTVPVLARLDAAGRYTAAVRGTTEVRRFGLVATPAGWRIEALEDGILVTRNDFRITFRDLPLYFGDPSEARLVPDVRWFPFGGTTSAPSAVVAELLAGPSTWLAPGVVSGVPTGTQLTVNAVRLADGVATVDLTASARSADARQRRLVKAQLESTLAVLGQLGSPVVRVAVTVEQQRFDLDAAVTEEGDGVLPALPPQIDPRPVALDARGAVVRVSGGVVEPVAGLALPVGKGTSAPAVSPSGRAYAVLAEERTRLVTAVPGTPASTLVVGQGLVAPSYDPQGWVWTTQEAGGALLAARPGETVARVAPGWLAGRTVSAVRLSREGARVVLVTARPGGPREVLAAAVVRDAQGRPSGLGPALPVLAGATDVGSVGWVDGTHVFVVASVDGSARMPWLVELGGDTRPTIAVQGDWVTVGNSELEMYQQLPSGAVRTRVGSGWSDVPGVRQPAMPG